jgi:hypothetical protein
MLSSFIYFQETGLVSLRKQPKACRMKVTIGAGMAAWALPKLGKPLNQLSKLLLVHQGISVLQRRPEHEA